MTPIRCSIIIVHYNTLGLLEDCLRSLASLPEAGELEVVVVDNGSKEASEAEQRALAIWPDLKWVGNERNMGFAAANNQGIRMTKRAYVCLLNSDTLVRPGALAALMNYLALNPRVAAVGPRLLNPDGTLQQSCYRVPTLLRTLGDGLLLTNALRALPAIDDYGRWPHDRERLVESVSGACMMVRRAAIAEVGLLDERFFMYAEESDWCRRFAKAGWQIEFCPDAEVVHLGKGSWSERGPEHLDQVETSCRAYFAKHYGSPGVILWHLSALVGSSLRALAAGRRAPMIATRHRQRVNWHLRHLWTKDQGRSNFGFWILDFGTGQSKIQNPKSKIQNPGFLRRAATPYTVAHIISTGGLAGTEHYVIQLLDNASPHVRCIVCCPDTGPLYATLRKAGHVAIPFDFSPRALPITTLKLAAQLRRMRVQVAHTHLGKATLVGAVAARLAGAQAVVTTQHFLLPAYVSTHHRVVRPLFRLGHRLVNAMLDRVITVSQAAGHAMTRREGLDPRKLVHIPCGVDPARFAFTSDRTEGRRALDLPMRAPVIITVGRLEWEKGYDLLIEAIPAILDAHPDATFLWVGAGSRAAHYEARLTKLGVRDRVRLLGHRSDVAACLALADVAVCPTPLEGFGLAVIEAMAADLPVVAIDAGGPVEIVAKGETGWLVPYEPGPLAAAVNRLLNNPHFARLMGEAGRRRVEACYTVQRMVSQTEAVYEDLLLGASGDRGSGIRDRD